MKRLLNTGLFYTLLGISAGLFYREFTKMTNYTGWTPLSVMHTHALVLGMLVFLILLLFEKEFQLTEHKTFNSFYYLYNTGLLMTLVMMGVRGITTVLNSTLSSGMNAAISGTAGLAHVILTVAIVQFFIILYRAIGKAN